MYRLMNIEMEP